MTTLKKYAAWVWWYIVPVVLGFAASAGIDACCALQRRFDAETEAMLRMASTIQILEATQ